MIITAKILLCKCSFLERYSKAHTTIWMQNDAKSGGDQVIVLHAIENAQRLNLSRSSPLGLTFASCSMVLRLVSRLRNLAKRQSDTALLRDGSGRFIYLKMQLDDNKILEHIDDSSLGYWMILGYIMIYWVCSRLIVLVCYQSHVMHGSSKTPRLPRQRLRKASTNSYPGRRNR
jgi:hypothetical protein